MKKLSKKQKEKLDFYILLSVTVISFLLWDTILLYPIKIFVILIHEISHGIMAILTGGQLKNININWNLSGSSTSVGGVPFLIAFAGYTGSIIIGALLFYSAKNIKLSIWLNTILTIVFILIVSNLMEAPAGIIFSLIFAVLLFASPRYFKKELHQYFVKTLGLVSCLYAVVDIKQDLLTLRYRPTDAELLADASGIPAIIWGLLWFTISVAAVYFLFRESFQTAYPKRKKNKSRTR